MPHTVIYPYTVVIHSQNTPSANTTMMSSGRLIVGTLLAVSQITTLPLDLVDGAVGVFNIGHKGQRHVTRVPNDGDGVGGEGHESQEGEDGCIDETRRRIQSQPFIYNVENGCIAEEPDYREN